MFFRGRLILVRRQPMFFCRRIKFFRHEPMFFRGGLKFFRREPMFFGCRLILVGRRLIFLCRLINQADGVLAAAAVATGGVRRPASRTLAQSLLFVFSRTSDRNASCGWCL
jgi:hypothetical protein